MIREGKWHSFVGLPVRRTATQSKLTGYSKPGNVVMWPPRQLKAVSVAPCAITNSQVARHLISDAHEWIKEIPCPYLLSSETTAKGTGLEELAGKEDPLELDSSLAL